MLLALTVLLGMQFVGEAIAHGFGLTVPGPVIGLALLAVAVASSRGLRETVQPTANVLLRHLSLLFVPAGVGIIQYLPRFVSEGFAMVVAVILSTAATLAVTALTFRLAARALRLRDEA